MEDISAYKLACIIARALDSKKGVDIKILNIGNVSVLADYFVKKNLEDVVVVSPDHGGTTRAREFAKVLETPIAIIDKRRPKANVMEVMNIIGNIFWLIFFWLSDQLIIRKLFWWIILWTNYCHQNIV